MPIHCLERIKREMKELPDYTSGTWTATPDGYNLLRWNATIHNLDDPRHTDKSYRLSIEIPENYPFTAPKVRFLDHVKCENVYYNGEICLDILNDAWSPVFTLWSLLETISSVLTDKPVTGLVNKVPANDIIPFIQTKRSR